MNKKEVALTWSKPDTFPYDGTAHQLISEDKTTLVGGDMQYALGENGSTAPTTGWSTSTPTATNAGT